MAFRKTSIALDMRPLPKDKGRELAASNAWEVGQVHPSDPDIIWDGEKWIPRAEWESRATEE